MSKNLLEVQVYVLGLKQVKKKTYKVTCLKFQRILTVDRIMT